MTTTAPHDAATAASAETSAGPSRRTVVGLGAALGVAVASTLRARPAAATTAELDRALRDLPAPARRDRLVDHEVVELAVLLRRGDVTAVQVLDAYLARIDALNGPFEVYGDNGGYNAFVRVDRAGARAAAEAADARFRAARTSGEVVPPLCGIPFGIKDSVGVEGREARNGTLAFAGNVALRDATVVARLREQGAVLLGHTIASAFSGSIAGTFAGNAWDPARVPGGSSQGSGVAPVARLCAAAIGEETGGSIIMPAAANGASAIKPSLGAASVAGVMPLSPGVDVVGPITRSVRDSVLVMNAIAGVDQSGDPLTLSAPMPFPEVPLSPRGGARPLAGLRIGVPQTDWMTAAPIGTPPQSTYGRDHADVWRRLVRQLRVMGATVTEFPGLDVTDPAQDPYFRSPDVLGVSDGTAVTALSAVVQSNRYEIRYWDAVRDFAATRPADQAAALLAQYGRVRPGTTERTWEAASALGGGITNAVRAEGERRRRRLQANYQDALDAADVDVMLVLPIGDHVGPRFGGGSQLPNYRRWFQLPNALGWPMVTFPVGLGRFTRLPVNAALWGPRFSEATIVQAAVDYQDRYPEHHRAAPPDPVFAPAPQARRAAAPEVVPPEYSNDPLVNAEADR